MLFRLGDVAAPPPWIPIDVDVPITNIDTGYNNSSTSLMTVSDGDGDNDSIRMLTYEDSNKVTAPVPITTTGAAGIAESSQHTETGVGDVGVGVEGSLMTTSSMTEVHYWHVTAQAQLPVRLLLTN